MSQKNVCVRGCSALHLLPSTYSLCGLFDRLSIACLFLFWETSCITVDGTLAAGEHVTRNKEELKKTETKETMIDCEIMKKGIN